MKFRRRRSLMPRVDWRGGLAHAEPLKGQLWTRSEQALREPDVHWAWRGLAVGAAVAECALLVWLWLGPALAVQNIDIVGAQHMTRAQIARAAGLSEGASSLSVYGEPSRRRLLNQTWVRTATVVPQLPGAVLIRVSEWQPVAGYHAGKTGKLYFLSDQAIVLGAAAATGPLVDLPLDVQLLVALVNIQRGLPGLIGQEVGGFIFDSCGQLTLVAKRGWKVYFGRVLTPEEFTTLRDKVAALNAIDGRVNYSSPDLDYVNVMNPSEPAVASKSLQPKPPAPGATPQPSPTPATACK